MEDYDQYGLTEPVCTIRITADVETYTVELGDFSKMDEQRYVSIGDGKAYLVSHDPLDEFGAVLRDMILDDTIPEFDTAKQIAFTGTENYTITFTTRMARASARTMCTSRTASRSIRTTSTNG